MNVVWIIGNGFDMNLGLRTGYGTFLEEIYRASEDERIASQRERLGKAIGDNPLCDASHWSDLEMLLGRVVGSYENDPEYFHETFESMEEFFVEYISEEEARFRSGEISEKDVVEFSRSVWDFWNRLADLDQDKIPQMSQVEESTNFQFVNLNYTAVFDAYVARMEARKRYIGSHTYVDKLVSPFHPHGQIEFGEPREVVFGVSEPDQLMCELFQRDEDICELWTKKGKNALFGNKNSSHLKTLIENGRIFCIFGSSLGETDGYIWRQIGARIRGNGAVRLILFEHSLPDRGGLFARLYQKKRRGLLDKFARVASLSPENMAKIESQVIVAPSDLVFRLKLPGVSSE